MVSYVVCRVASMPSPAFLQRMRQRYPAGESSPTPEGDRDLPGPATGLEADPILAVRHQLGAVLIRSRRFACDVWVVLDQATAAEILAEEARRDDPRPVFQPCDIAALRGKSEAAVRAALDVARTFAGSRFVQ